jgi:hypothetical protein
MKSFMTVAVAAIFFSLSAPTYASGICGPKSELCGGKIVAFASTLPPLDTCRAYCGCLNGPDGKSVCPGIYEKPDGSFYLLVDSQEIPMTLQNDSPYHYKADPYDVRFSSDARGNVGSVEYGPFPNLANCHYSGEGGC